MRCRITLNFKVQKHEPTAAFRPKMNVSCQQKCWLKKLPYKCKGFLDNITVLLLKWTQYHLFLMQLLVYKMNIHKCWKYVTGIWSYSTDHWGVCGGSACFKGIFTSHRISLFQSEIWRNTPVLLTEVCVAAPLCDCGKSFSHLFTKLDNMG